MSGPRYRVEIEARPGLDDESNVLVLVVDTAWREEAERYGSTAAEIATSVAADFADLGDVRVVNVANPDDFAQLRRAPV